MPIFERPFAVNGAVMLTPEGLVWFDESGARWFAPPGEHGIARVTSEVETAPLLGRSYSPSLGLLALTTDARVLAARPLDAPFALASRLPAGSAPLSFRALRGGFTVRGPAAMLASTDGASYTPVPGMAGHALRELLMDPTGRGVGLFVPEQIAFTSDRGLTWQPVSTTGVAARLLVETTDGPAVRPGGLRDGFARKIDLATGALERMLLPEPDARMATAVATMEVNGGPEQGTRMPLWTETYHPPPLDAAPAPVTDGDDALVVGVDNLSYERWAITHDAKGHAGRGGQAPAHLGRLGEGFHGLAGEGPPTHLGCRASSIALCNGVAAIACADSIEIFVRGTRRPAVASVPGTAVGFDAAGQLLSVSPPAKPGGTPTLRVHASDGTEGSSVPLPALPPSAHGLYRFAGGCHRPALWVATDTHAARWDGAAFEPAVPLDGAPFILGVNDARELVHGGTLMRFSPSGATAAMRLDPRYTSFSEDGRRGLALRDLGDMVQSLDGGHSWTAIATPDIWDFPPVVCGKTHCAVGAGVFLDGEGAALPRGSAPKAKPSGGAFARDTDREHGPIALRCEEDPRLFAKPAEIDQTVYPALSDALFQVEVREVLGDDGKVRVPAHWFTGGLSGTTRRSPDARWRTWTAETSVRGGESRTARIRALLVPPPAAVAALLAVELLRDLQGVDYQPLAPQGPGVADASASGQLLVAQEIEPGIVLLGHVEGDAVSHPRTLTVRLHDPIETGIGLSHGPAGERTVWLIDDTEDGHTEIRSHALRPDFSLGPGVPVPNTRTARDKLLELPSCPPGATGAVLRTQARHRMSVAVGPKLEDGWLQRLLRVTATSACVERTFVTGWAGQLSSAVVVAGNRGIAAGTLATPGMRCEPAAVTGR